MRRAHGGDRDGKSIVAQTWRIRDFFTAGLRSPAVLVVIGLTTTVYLYRGLFGWAPDIQQGQWWRLATSQLLHHSWWHLWGNMWPLYLFGPVLESAYGRFRFVVVYTFTAVCGVLLAIGIAHDLGFAGASVAVWGIRGFVLFVVLSRVREPGMWAYLVGIVLNAATELAPYTEANLHVNEVHLYGFATGVALAVGFAVVRRGRWAAGSQAATTLTALLVAVVLPASRWPQTRG